ncbi:TIGR00159 family protein [bacterium F11]|nr:TIGR00159 family protein [bacterium F11]
MEYIGLIWNRYLVNIFDILFVGFLFYHLLLLIKGTRAVQIIFGIVVVAVLTLLAQILGFPSLSWLLQKFWIAGVIVIAVLFQPEIRSALARLGARTAGRFVATSEMQAVNELIGAVKEGSRRQMGMLIVIERDTGLRNYVESGTLINGELSRELLLTLFQPPSDLHDGAVIVRGNQLAAAGCILPLSSDLSLSKLLGTRHRAAVGISEVSDAWSICVSEETGNISVSVDGKINTQVDPDELRQQLVNLFNANVAEGPRAEEGA